MGDPLFQFTGVTSQIDWGTMLDKIMENARKPEKIWQEEKDKLELKKGLYDELSASMKQLRNSITSLKLSSTYNKKQAELTSLEAGKSANAILTATADTSAAINQWTIKVNQVAKAERRTSDRFDSVNSALNLSGTFRIYVGKQWAEVTVANSDSLRDINLKIQKALDSTGSNLAITSKIVDNRIVIESASTGLGKSGPKSFETFKMGSSNTFYLPREVNGWYPSSVTIQSGSVTYASGTDYTYNASTGTITWLSSNKPAAGSDFKVTYSQDTETVTRGTGPTDNMALPSPRPSSIVINQGSNTYVEGTHFTYNSSTGEITWTSPSQPAPSTNYTVKYLYYSNDNVFYLQDVAGTVVSGNKLSGTGLGLMGTSGYTAAKNAIFEVDGQAVERNSNKVDDLIAGVTLNLVGTGTVKMDVTVDAQASVEGLNNFVTAYNDVMDWINIRLSEESKAEKTSGSTKNDDFYKKFGLLHGDPLLWQIKDQMRQLISFPMTNLPNTYTSRGYISTTTPLNLKGDMVLDIGGMRARISVSESDSLENIKAKLTGLTDATAGSSGTPKGGDLPISVSIENGKLIIRSTSSSIDGRTTRSDTVSRNTASSWDLLPYTPSTSAPISGALVIKQGSTVYTENVDYTVQTVENSNGAFESRIVWLSGGKRPSGNYSVQYTYDPGKVAISTTGSLSTMGFSQDGTRNSVTYAGIATEKANYGKSGKLEFDVETFMTRMKDDNNGVANLMSSIMNKLDQFLGNMVDTTQVTVGTEVVVKGRIAARVSSIKEQQKAIDKRIADFENRLKIMQQSYYNQFVAMEKTISKMNQQLSWLAGIVAQLSGVKQQ
jgi:flagellar hook-associated protein 2